MATSTLRAGQSSTVRTLNPRQARVRDTPILCTLLCAPELRIFGGKKGKRIWWHGAQDMKPSKLTHPLRTLDSARKVVTKPSIQILYSFTSDNRIVLNVTI